MSIFVVIFSILLVNIVPILSQTCTNGLTSPQAVRHGATGNDIEWTEIFTNTYATTLVFDVVNQRFTTRLHNDSLPSPTLRFERGKQYQVTLINNLGPESVNNPTGHNVQKDPNTTNIHTHGLHIGGMSPGDNVHIKLLPGEQHTYIYNIPCDHSGGTFWYHPHHHGSTEIQVAMGAAGALIIEDSKTDENLPDWYSNMQELIFFITHINLPQVGNIPDPSWDFVWSRDKPNAGPPGENNLYLVNGEYQPNICMTAGEYIKFRFVQVEGKVPRKYYIADGECTTYLLARDGVIVHGLNDNDVPRLIGNIVWLAQPSRADVAIFCPGHVSGDITYNITVNDTNDDAPQTIATIQVIGTATTPITTLVPFTPTRPSYLENLLDYSGSLPTQQYENRFGQDIDYWENLRVTGSDIAGIAFANETNYLQRIEVNTINTWEVVNAGSFFHPFHVHINHFQIVNSTLPVVAPDPVFQQYYPPDGFQVIGDWQDTIWGPGLIRFKADTWAGTITMHCHILKHEDEGAMGTVEIISGCDNSYNHYSPSNACDYVDKCGQFTPTANPTTDIPTNNPAPQPTTIPTQQPTNNPTAQPTSQPTINPTEQPTNNPTQQPTDNPTPQPTGNPTSQPTDNPITPGSPTSAPTQPTNNPTTQPTDNPTQQPTDNPTSQDSQPTSQPTSNPTTQPTNTPNTGTPITSAPVTSAPVTSAPVTLAPVTSTSSKQTTGLTETETTDIDTTISGIDSDDDYPWWWCRDHDNWNKCKFKLRILMNILCEWLTNTNIDIDNIQSIFKSNILLQYQTYYDIFEDNMDIDIQIEQILNSNANAAGDDDMSNIQLDIIIMIGTDSNNSFANILSDTNSNNSSYNVMYDLIEIDVNALYINASFNIITSMTESLIPNITTTTSTGTTKSKDDSDDGVIITDPSTYNTTYWMIFGVIITFLCIIFVVILFVIKKCKSNENKPLKQYRSKGNIEGQIIFGQTSTRDIATGNAFDSAVANIGLSKLTKSSQNVVVDNDNNTEKQNDNELNALNTLNQDMEQEDSISLV